jgi:hypothetical protein
MAQLTNKQKQDLSHILSRLNSAFLTPQHKAGKIN